jgi:hypothetical protein
MSKNAALLFIAVLTVSSLVIVKAAPASAQLVPEFTLKLVAFPYDVPTTYGIDPYTGKNVTVQEGYRVENKSVEIVIENQRTSNLFYNVRYKGHFGESWTTLYSYSMYSSESLKPQSSSAYTVISIPAAFPYGELDFQAEALSWHYVDVWLSDHPMAPPPISEIGHYERRFTLDKTSGWSNTQTIAFAAPLPSVALLSPQEVKFNTSDVPLDFAVDQPVSQLKYSLDGQENVTVTGNTTLTGLKNGPHNITVYARGETGNIGSSETFFFEVEVPEPFPTIATVAIIAVLGSLVCTGIIWYLRKKIKT